ncbi:MAG: hypothetical protein PVG74_20090 [Desulfobacterales bacterium]|jgi:hypothetical protein
MESIRHAQKPNLRIVPPFSELKSTSFDIENLLNKLNIPRSSPENFAASLPFSLNDTTVGIENELQTAVVGPAEKVDLPVTIKESNYYQNILRNTQTGSTSRQVLNDLEKHLNRNHEEVWENSWVHLPRKVLCKYARNLFKMDLQADKTNPAGPARTDAGRFSIIKNNETFLRFPVSYLLKLALADAIGDSDTDSLVQTIGERLMSHFLSDNTSPEIFSFFPVRLSRSEHRDDGAASETAKRFLFCQLLIDYANLKFDLISNYQKVEIYFSPQPPLRQKMLNSIISDAFYRELFMSPCLSGWTKGEVKYRYMVLCHQVLSRSQLNAIKKLKEANIITNNLVVLPNTSNTSLANNGTHVSLGSLKLTALLQDQNSGFRAEDEKYIGDLSIKIIEHFLPIFVGTYTAAPYRFDFQDFHPEKALGFLPHELDFTHLRMIWRRWKQKANLNFLGYPMTPFGPEWLDQILSKILSLKGDFIVDYRLIDYLVALLSTERSPALNGQLNNEQRLKEDLAALGVFDTSMPLYCLYRMRQHSVSGFSGFEGRHYSLYDSLLTDLDNAIRLQSLLTALAFKYIMKETVRYQDIPDNPFTESERRQIFFGAAIGIPTFFIRKDSPNRFMQKIIKAVKKTRLSRRYPGYIRVHNIEYRKALVDIIRRDAADLIEVLDLQETILDLHQRLCDPENFSVHSKLTKGILDKVGTGNPLAISAYEFNSTAEEFYREDLKRRHIAEGFQMLRLDFAKIDSWQSWRSGKYNKTLWKILKGRGAEEYLRINKKDVLNGDASVTVLKTLLHLMLLTIHQNMEQADHLIKGK